MPSLPSGTVHKLSKDIEQALRSHVKALATWNDITPLARNEWICWMTSAKQEETRKRRIRVGMSKLGGGMRRPCCWAGCTHR
jgi:uncharacterized protein YdeI (YjbR/CyaY-like superfamily)